ncbi:hypothetical protein QVD17_38232 [Tagetes erecta]|uniref:Uncharacterized protein n=1 Tax=Tagetes erecta TaxID=13708 RepID=A0AAD8JXQ3_TARER|nr:hypothetical protein QVD17_38232 [Tagetes erecta]
MGFWQPKVQVHRWWIAPVHGRIFNPIAKFMELSASITVPLHLISMLLFTSLLLHLKDTLFSCSMLCLYILSITTDFFSFTMAAPTRKMAASTRTMAAPTRKMAAKTRIMGLKERSSYDQLVVYMCVFYAYALLHCEFGRLLFAFEKLLALLMCIIVAVDKLFVFYTDVGKEFVALKFYMVAVKDVEQELKKARDKVKSNWVAMQRRLLHNQDYKVANNITDNLHKFGIDHLSRGGNDETINSTAGGDALANLSCSVEKGEQEAYKGQRKTKFCEALISKSKVFNTWGEQEAYKGQ